MVAFSIRELVLMEMITDVWLPLLPKTDEQLVRELTSMMLGYLRYEGGDSRDGGQGAGRGSD